LDAYCLLHLAWRLTKFIFAASDEVFSLKIGNPCKSVETDLSKNTSFKPMTPKEQAITDIALDL
jgi:hypothetical protein